MSHMEYLASIIQPAIAGDVYAYIFATTLIMYHFWLLKRVCVWLYKGTSKTVYLHHCA